MTQIKILENETNSLKFEPTQPETFELQNMIIANQTKLKHSVSREDKFKRVANYKERLNKKL